MGKSKKSAPVAPVRLDAVGTAINKAGQAASTMLDAVREAATLAAPQLDPAQPLKARIDIVVALYAADFSAAGHNVRALFVDALTLLACAQTPVTVRGIGAGGKMEDQHTTAKAALTASKHSMRDAAKQVREAHGIARKVAAKTAAKAAPATAPAGADVKTETDAFSRWLGDLPKFIGDAVYHPKLVAVLIEQGWSLSKAAPGKPVKGKAGV